MATKKSTAPKKGQDPREGAGQSKETQPTGGSIIQQHEHLAAAGKRRLLSDTDGEDKAPAKVVDKKVTVRIPRAFNLNVLDHAGSRMVRYEAGTDEMPESHAKHDYAIANGVEIVDEE